MFFFHIFFKNFNMDVGAKLVPLTLPVKVSRLILLTAPTGIGTCAAAVPKSMEPDHVRLTTPLMRLASILRLGGLIVRRIRHVPSGSAAVTRRSALPWPDCGRNLTMRIKWPKALIMPPAVSQR